MSIDDLQHEETLTTLLSYLVKIHIFILSCVITTLIRFFSRAQVVSTSGKGVLLC